MADTTKRKAARFAALVLFYLVLLALLLFLSRPDARPFTYQIF
jgi:cbb3-type cytochrome oxidase subunit 3